MSTTLIVIVAVGVVALLLAIAAIRIVREYQRVVVFRLGRLRGARPGTGADHPADRADALVNLQVDTADIPPQDLITKDNVTIRVEAAVFYRVVDPIKAVVAIRDYKHGDVADRADDAARDARPARARRPARQPAAIKEQLKQIDRRRHGAVGRQRRQGRDQGRRPARHDEAGDGRQAEAERERRAKVIAAEGEFQAAERLSQAAGVIAREPGTLTLRTLQTLAEVATEHNSTLVLPIPIDVLEAVRHHAEATGAQTQAADPLAAATHP